MDQTRFPMDRLESTNRTRVQATSTQEEASTLRAKRIQFDHEGQSRRDAWGSEGNTHQGR